MDNDFVFVLTNPVTELRTLTLGHRLFTWKFRVGIQENFGWSRYMVRRRIFQVSFVALFLLYANESIVGSVICGS